MQFNIVSNFVFHCKKAKQYLEIIFSIFFPVFKKRNQIHDIQRNTEF